MRVEPVALALMRADRGSSFGQTTGESPSQHRPGPLRAGCCWASVGTSGHPRRHVEPRAMATVRRAVRMPIQSDILSNSAGRRLPPASACQRPRSTEPRTPVDGRGEPLAGGRITWRGDGRPAHRNNRMCATRRFVSARAADSWGCPVRARPLAPPGSSDRRRARARQTATIPWTAAGRVCEKRRPPSRARQWRTRRNEVREPAKGASEWSS